MDQKKANVSKKLIAGYSTAGFGMGLATTSFFAYFLFFLTTIVGFDPAIGGLVILVAVLWDGVTDPGVGYFSDNNRSRYGKRRPFILVGAIPFGLLTALMFTDVDFVSGVGKQIYFLGINMAFWLFFTMSDIPWAALGSEMTHDFNEKTKIRTASATMVQMGTFAGLALILPLVGYGREMFGTDTAGWSFAGAIVGLVITATYLFTWNATRGAEPTGDQVRAEALQESESIIELFSCAFKNKPMRYLLGLTLLFVMANSGVWAATLLFLVKFNLGIAEESRQAIYLSIWGIGGILLTPLVGWISTRFSDTLGKAKTLGFAILVTLATLVAVKLIGLNETSMVFLMIGIAFGHSAFWLFVYVLAYDVGAVETYVTGENKDGIVVSIMSFTLKLGMGLGLGLGGVLLSYYGFNENADVQTEQALAGIETIFFVWGGGFVLLAAIFCFLFPIDKQKYVAIKEATERRAAGKEYSEEAFADLL